MDVGPLEIVVILVVAVLVFGPDKLPDFIRTVARVVKQGRTMIANAQNELKNELGDSMGDFDVSDLRNLNPRTMLKNTLLGENGENPFDGVLNDKPVSTTMEQHTPRPKPSPPLAAGEKPPFDPEST